MGLHGVPLLVTEARRISVEARGRSAVTRGVSTVVRGTPWTWPWNAVEVRGHCRGAPPKRQIMYDPRFWIRNVFCRRRKRIRCCTFFFRRRGIKATVTVPFHDYYYYYYYYTTITEFSTLARVTLLILYTSRTRINLREIV